MQVKLVKLNATKLKLTDMLLGFLECFSLREEKNPKTQQPAFFPPFLLLIRLNYLILSVQQNATSYSELLWLLPPLPGILFFFFELFFLILEIRVFIHYCLIYEIIENQFDAHLWGFILCTEHNTGYLVLRPTVCVQPEKFLELNSPLERKIYWDKQAFFLR